MSPLPPPHAAPASPEAVPAGWYLERNTMRWWDGRAWGPVAPAPGPSSDDRALSTLCHLGPVLGGIVAPLVIYLVANDHERPESRWHAREALNFQLTFLVVYLAGFLVFFVGLATSAAFVTSDSDNPVGPDAGVGLGFGLSFVAFAAFAFVVFACDVVFSGVAAHRAHHGIRWKYPIRIPFVKA